MEFNQKLFISRLRQLLEEKEITQKELSLKIGVSEVTISRYLSGERNPRTDVINSISNYFKVSADYLLGNSDVKTPIKEVSQDLSTWLLSVDEYKDLPKEDRDMIVNFAKLLAKRYKGIKD